MKLYRKKPATTEAIQFTDEASGDEIIRWAKEYGSLARWAPNGVWLEVESEGTMKCAEPNDFVVKDVDAELHVYRPNKFKAIYEEMILY